MKRLSVLLFVSVLFVVPAYAQVVPFLLGLGVGSAMSGASPQSIYGMLGGMLVYRLPGLEHRVAPEKLLDVKYISAWYKGQYFYAPPATVEKDWIVYGISLRELFEKTVSNAKEFEVLGVAMVPIPGDPRKCYFWYAYLYKKDVGPLSTPATGQIKK